jgi:hypothetical protein
MPASKKHASRTRLQASQIAPLIVEKGPFYNRPFFKGRFSVVFTKKGSIVKRPFFQGAIQRADSSQVAIFF